MKTPSKNEEIISFIFGILVEPPTNTTSLISEIPIFKEYCGTEPVLLLDDIFSELDIKKRYNNENLDKCYEEIKGEILRLKQ